MFSSRQVEELQTETETLQALVHELRQRHHFLECESRRSTEQFQRLTERVMKEMAQQRDEVEALKAEVETLKRAVRERDTEIEALKACVRGAGQPVRHDAPRKFVRSGDALNPCDTAALAGTPDGPVQPLFIGNGRWNWRELFGAIRNKPNIAIVATTEDERTFGVHIRRPIAKSDCRVFDPDLTVFVARPGDADEPYTKFSLRPEVREHAFVRFCQCSPKGVVNVGVDGVGQLWIGNDECDSFCEGLSRIFAGLGDDGLTGQSGRDHVFHCTRVVVLDMTPQGAFAL